MDLDLACLSFDQIQKLKELKKFESCMEFIPDCDISENEIFVCRSSISSLPKKVWRNIQDPKIGTLAHKNKFVSCYEMVCLYSFKKSGVVSVPANTSISKRIVLNHSSTFRQTDSSIHHLNMNFKGSIGTPSNDGNSGSSNSNTAWNLETVLQYEYNITREKEYIQTETIENETTISYDKVDFDRMIVYWDLVETILIYRKGLSDIVELVAANDYLMSCTGITYKVK